MSSYSYEFEQDYKYCYENSNVLKNKFDIRDSTKLYELENDFTSLTTSLLYKEPLVGCFDLNHLKKIHKAVFDDVYDWAGELRVVNISKGIEFCMYQNIETQFDILHKELVTENYLLDLKDKDEAIKRYAYYFSEVNVIHPFREGNGRTQRIYINFLSRLSGYKLDFYDISKEEMIEACYEGFYCKYEKMENLINKCISKINYKNEKYYKELFKNCIRE